MKAPKKGFEILRDKELYKSISFTREEREELGLTGLLPYTVSTQQQLVDRVMEMLRREPDDLRKYMLLSALQERNERLFYRVAIDHIEEIMPLIYTPTVGQACKTFSHISREPKGFFITPEDRGRIHKILGNWPATDIRVIVVTDGQRILGLGDLGANGMGIPVGKLALYSACAGIPPGQCLPVMLDVGTNNQEFLDDLLYLGYPQKRIEGKQYFDLVEEFVMAVQERYPDALIQFEDFLTPNAYALLREYRNRVLCFNDDIQGTAAVAVAGVYASTRITKLKFSDFRIMFLGAGSAATGIGDLMVSAFQKEGLSRSESFRRLWFVDVNGLVVSGRKDLMEHNLPYAHNHEPATFLEAIDDIKPHVLIGATGAPGTFSKEVIEHLCAVQDRPVVFALSNPTSKAECTAEQAYTWSDGRAIFASGSPFGKFHYKGRVYRTGQGNNAYVFPGIGLAAVTCRARTIPDEFFLTAANTLAEMVEEKEILDGCLYPPLPDLREVSLGIAEKVSEKAYELGLARTPRPANIRQSIEQYMYDPHY